MPPFLKRHLPSQESLRSNRWLRWLGPRLFSHALWRWSRRGVATGLALGVFFGFLIPVGQIPLAAGAAIVMRANVPAAIASTLVTNPVTFAPVYYAAYQFGHWVVGNPNPPEPPAPDQLQTSHTQPRSHPASWWHRVQSMGKPLLIGLASFAIGFGLLVYALSTWVWIWRVKRKRRLRRSPPKRVM